VYAEVVDDHQTYDRREVQLLIAEDGKLELTMDAGNTPGGPLGAPERHCRAVARSTQDEQRLSIEIDSSSCRAAPAGSRTQIQLHRVGECLVQWNTLAGTMPYEVAQIAFRRRDCR
jgi:hypothetical protein